MSTLLGSFNINDVFSVIGMIFDAIPQALLAMGFGFGMFPTGITFIVGAFLMVLFGQVVPISFQSETIALVGSMGKNRNERFNIIFYAGILEVVLSLFGAFQFITRSVGNAVMLGVMAGVGIILARIGVDQMKGDRLVGGSSIVSAVITYFITKDTVTAIIVSVVLSTVISLIRSGYQKSHGLDTDNIALASKEDKFVDKISFLKFNWNGNIVRGVLSMLALEIGGNIAYSKVTAQMAHSTLNVDHITLSSGIGDMLSGFLGGSPIQTVISATGAAPHPMLSAFVFMIIMAILLLTHSISKLGKIIPGASIAGFLFVLGALVVFPENVGAAVTAQPLVAGVAVIVTAMIDPFSGLAAGFVAKIILGMI